jgi:hypothetical protein
MCHVQAVHPETQACMLVLPSETRLSKPISCTVQSVQLEKVNILGGHSIGDSKRKNVYIHVTYAIWFPR